MSDWKIFDIGNSKEWSEMVESCKQPDIHFLPEYMKLYEEKVEGKATLFVSFDHKNDNLVLYPFFLRNLKKIKKFSNLTGEFYDIISPWYYGGPLIKNDNNISETLKNFLEDFQKYIETKNVVTEFTRVHPLLDKNEVYSSLVEATSHDCISYIDLKEPLEIIWKNFKKSNRNAINAAKRNGIEIKFSTSEKSMNVFSKLYNDNMKRLKASDWYIFSFEFFKKFMEVFKNKFIIVEAVYQKKPISASLFVYGYGISYYWLSGYDYTKRNLYSNNLILFEIIKWLKEAGNNYFILGGGDYHLNKFKQSFTKTIIKKFHVCKIHNQKKYEILINTSKQKISDVKNNFFPEYRI